MLSSMFALKEPSSAKNLITVVRQLSADSKSEKIILIYLLGAIIWSKFKVILKFLKYKTLNLYNLTLEVTVKVFLDDSPI